MAMMPIAVDRSTDQLPGQVQTQNAARKPYLIPLFDFFLGRSPADALGAVLIDRDRMLGQVDSWIQRCVVEFMLRRRAASRFTKP